MNSVNIIGRMVYDAELKYTPSNKAVCTFAIACDTGSKDKPFASFFDCEVWERQAEIVSEFCKKGHQVGISGRMIQDRWETEGQKRSKVKIVVSHVTLLNNRRDSADQTPSSYAGEENQTPVEHHNGFDGSREAPADAAVPF